MLPHVNFTRGDHTHEFFSYEYEGKISGDRYCLLLSCGAQLLMNASYFMTFCFQLLLTNDASLKNPVSFF